VLSRSMMVNPATTAQTAEITAIIVAIAKEFIMDFRIFI